MRNQFNKNTFYVVIRDRDNDLLRFPRNREFYLPKDSVKIHEAENDDGTLKEEYKNLPRYYEKYKDDFLPLFIANLRGSLKREEVLEQKTNLELADLLLKSDIYQYREVFTYESDLLEIIMERLKNNEEKKKTEK